MQDSFSFGSISFGTKEHVLHDVSSQHQCTFKLTPPTNVMGATHGHVVCNVPDFYNELVVGWLSVMVA